MTKSWKTYVAITCASFFVLQTIAVKASYGNKDGARIVQNLMTTSPVHSVIDRVLYFTISRLPENHYFYKILSNISSNTCIRFSKINHLELTKARTIGLASSICNLRDLNFRRMDEKLHRKTIMRIFGCLGKLYEHQRMDRDQYIDINWENIRFPYASKLKKIEDSTTLGLPYDFDSIMQLSYDKYSKNNFPTILPKNASIPMEKLGGATWPSEQDYLEINLYYCGTGRLIIYFRLNEAGTDFFSMIWKVDRKSDQYFWELYVQCRLLCESEPYVKLQKDLPRSHNALNIHALKPNSKCYVNLRANFHAARFDPGLTRAAQTHSIRPTKPPGNVQITSVTESQAILTWEPIPCSYQNGEIFTYVVRYDHELLPENALEHEVRTDGGQLGITLKRLRPNTDYVVRVAGVNSAGAGVFSLPKALITFGARPGKVILTSSSSTSSSISISWTPPLDENNLPYKVRLKYSYTHRFKKITVRKILSCTRYTVENLRSDLSVKFSLKAVNKRGKKGPSTYTTIRTKPSGNEE